MRERLVGTALLLAGLLVPTFLAAPVGAAQDAPAQDSAVQDSAVQAAQDSADAGGAVQDPEATDETPEPIQPSQQAEDERIRSELQAIFDRVPSLNGITASVAAGVVTLGGEVPDSQAETRAAELARGLDGVVYVDSADLRTVATSDRLEDVWSRLREKTQDTLALLPLIGVAILIVVVFSFIARAAGTRRAARLFPRMNPFILSMVQRLAQFALVVIGLIIALDLLDATALVGAVVGTAGLAGLAIGFAFKDIAENYLAGVILSFRHPFEKNDWVAVAGHEGRVVRLTGRETILMTLDGNHVQIPNAVVFNEPMVNYTRNPRRRFIIEFGVAGDTVLSHALDAGIEVLRGMNGVEDEPAPQGFVQDFGDSTTIVRFTGWVDQRNAEWLRVRSEARRLLKLGLEGAGVVLPVPEVTIHVPEGARFEVPSARRPTTTEPAAATESAVQRDVSVDLALDQQIAEDRRSAGQENLLDDDQGAGSEGGAGQP